MTREIQLVPTHKISYSEFLPLAVRGWHELLQAGLADGGVLLAWDNQVIGLKLDGEPVGVMVWSDQEFQNTCFINLAYVLPGHRRQRHHTRMFNELVEHVRTLGRTYVLAGTHPSNHASLDSMVSQHREVAGVLTRFKL